MRIGSFKISGLRGGRRPAFYVIGPGLVLLYFAVHAMLSPRSQVCGPAFTHGNRHGDEVALTFDDGPNEPYTDEILSILKKNHVKATFFVVGENALRYPEALRHEVQDGMEIGNHSYSHPYMIPEKSSTMFWQIQKTEQIIERIAGVRPEWFRPPHGFRDPRLFRQTRRLDLTVVEWSNMPRDWTRPGIDVIVQRTLNALKPGDIILLHDGDNIIHGGDRSQTVAALPYILAGLKSRGLKPVTLSQLAKSGGRGLRDYRRFMSEDN